MESNGQFGRYNIDICLCIDKTGSMAPIIDTVKHNALNLYQDVRNQLEEKGKHVDQFRIRVVWFGDYLADKKPMLMSRFLSLPEDEKIFEEFVKGVQPDGGGDNPEDGLEALAYAIRSDWCKTGWKKRHIVAVFTDAPPHDLGYGRAASTYPKAGMPEDFGKLSEMWGDEDNSGEMDFRAKRLLLFAPKTSYWDLIGTSWENTVIRPAEADNGLEDVSYQAILNVIVNSV